MTLETTAWAINGARTDAALARRAAFAALGSAQGIVQKDDLKVTALSTPGQGVEISAGVGVITNGYQTVPNETYVASNPNTHTIPSGEMPASSGSARSFIVAVVIGDPDFAQTGHPWMGADDPPEGEEETFSYVRMTLVQVSAGVTVLPAGYPGLVLARIDIPSSTTTITNAMITDLRKLARPRQEQQMAASGNVYDTGSPAIVPHSSTLVYATWGATEFPAVVAVPAWAKRAIISARLNGVILFDSSVNVLGSIRAKLGALAGPGTTFDVPIGTGAVRMNLEAVADINVSTVAGTTQNLRVEGYQSQPSSVPVNNRRPQLVSGSQVIFDIRFFEQ